MAVTRISSDPTLDRREPVAPNPGPQPVCHRRLGFDSQIRKEWTRTCVRHRENGGGFACLGRERMAG
jgi:hypothetical protein